jgi:predicted ATPase
MPRVVITGGPGSGKTTLLKELDARGFATVGDSAREVIAERLARGEAPRPDLPAFARQILGRDIANYHATAPAGAWIFFDRGVPDSIAFVHEVSPLPDRELHEMLGTYKVHPTVFVLPPWQEIYCTDSERDQTFDDARRVHDRVVRWYRACGYNLDEVPREPTSQRAAHVVGVLGLRARDRVTK